MHREEQDWAARTGARAARWLFTACLIFLLAVAGPAAFAWFAFQSYIHDDIAEVADAPVAIVLGAGLWPDGSVSPMLADRVDAGVELYRAGKVSRLLMSGDNGRASYDEVTAMKKYAVQRGVPPERINLDHAGFRTYDTAYRALHVFGVRRAVFVSQRYHLPRAVYTARMLGIDASGYVAGHDNYRGQNYYNAREVAGLTVAWYEVNVIHPLPRYLGEPIDLETQRN